MARTVIVETALNRDTALDVPGGSAFQAFDNTNGMYLAGSSPRKSGGLILDLKNTNGAARTVTIKAPTNGADMGPSWRQALGDLAIVVAATTGNQKIHVADTARFKQADGTINIDCSGSNVTIAAYRLQGAA